MKVRTARIPAGLGIPHRCVRDVGLVQRHLQTPDVPVFRGAQFQLIDGNGQFDDKPVSAVPGCDPGGADLPLSLPGTVAVEPVVQETVGVGNDVHAMVTGFDIDAETVVAPSSGGLLSLIPGARTLRIGIRRIGAVWGARHVAGEEREAKFPAVPPDQTPAVTLSRAPRRRAALSECTRSRPGAKGLRLRLAVFVVLFI